MLKGVLGHPAWTDDPAVVWWQPWAQRVKDAGLDFVRFDLYWQDANVLAKAKSIVGILTNVGLRAHVSFGGSGPAWNEPAPEAYAAAAADVAAVLPLESVLEVWNEPNIVPNFWPGSPNPVHYATIAQHTYDAVKSQAAHVIVSAPHIAFADKGFLSQYVALAPRSFDWLAVHPYTVGLSACPDDPNTANNGWQSFRGTLAMAREVLDSAGLQAPLQISEIGWPVADPGPSHYRAAVQLARQNDVVAFAAYNLGDHPAEQNSYSLFNTDGSPTLALQVFAEA